VKKQVRLASFIKTGKNDTICSVSIK
jgi:hypothetical protein